MTANVRIVNYLEGDVRPYRLTLIPLDDPLAESLTLPYNPEAYDDNVSPEWADDGLAGAEQNSASWSRNGTRQFRFRMRLTAGSTGSLSENGSVNRDYGSESLVETIITRLRNLATRPTDLTQEPTRFDVIAGEFFFTGHISNMKTRRIQTNERGHATEAEIDLTFDENVRR